MEEKSERKILATVSGRSFVGRDAELRSIQEHARSNESRPIAILAAPFSGAGELLRQAYDRLFNGQKDIVPFYFEFRPTDVGSKSAAIRYLQSFLVQMTAFRRRDPKLLAITPDVCEIGELSSPTDSEWIKRLVDSCQSESVLNDDATFLRHAFSAPIRAAIEGIKVFPMIGGIEYADRHGSRVVIDHLKEVFSASSSPYLLAGKRRFLANALKRGSSQVGDYKPIELRGFDLDAGSMFCEALADKTGISTTAQTRDLISLQLEGSPQLINAMFESAVEQETPLDSFRDVQQIYVGEIFGGRIRGFYDTCFDILSADPGIQRRLVDLVFSSKEFTKTAAHAESWNASLKLDADEFANVISTLNAFEFINASSNLIAGGFGSTVFDDYLEMRFRMEVERTSRPSVYGETLTKVLKRAPRIMAGHYRKRSSVGLRDLLSLFNCQEIPNSLLYYELFKENHKGKTDEQIKIDVAAETAKTMLPQIVFAVNTVSIYKNLGKFTEKERSAVAIGFEAGDYDDESETAWIAAEIDSKLEANAELTEFWCDRLEMVALMSDYHSFRIWLISPEGFSEEAVRVLESRNAIGSSRKQVELLVPHIGAENVVGSIKPDNAYEMIVPMGEDTELIAAHAVEEIARRHSFGSKAINQIKTALVEACINATEHSHSPDRKIYQRFEIEDGKIIITVSNRGLRFKGNNVKAVSPSEGRRGWGLKLMKSLMDDVSFEQVDDGTRIRMTKNLTTG